jgi:hypothetical protein
MLRPDRLGFPARGETNRVVVVPREITCLAWRNERPWGRADCLAAPGSGSFLHPPTSSFSARKLPKQEAHPTFLQGSEAGLHSSFAVRRSPGLRPPVASFCYRPRSCSSAKKLLRQEAHPTFLQGPEAGLHSSFDVRRSMFDVLLGYGHRPLRVVRGVSWLPVLCQDTAVPSVHVHTCPMNRD